MNAEKSRLVRLVLQSRESAVFSYLFNKIYSESPEIYTILLDFIEQEHPENVCSFLADHLKVVENLSLKIRTAEILAIYGEKEPVVHLIEGFPDRYPDFICSLIRIIAHLRLSEHYQAVMELFSRNSEQIKIEVIRSLHLFKSQNTLALLMKTMGDCSEKLLTECLLSLQKIHEYGIIERYCTSQNPTVRMFAVSCISEAPLDNDRVRINAQKIYQNLLSDSNEMVRLACIRNIRTANSSIVGQLFRCFDEMNPFYHRSIASAITRLGRENTVIKDKITEQIRKYLVSTMLTAVKLISDNEFISAVQRFFTLKEKKEDLEKFNTYLEAKKLSSRRSEIAILQKFINIQGLEHKKYFIDALEKITVLTDINSLEPGDFQHMNSFIEIAGKLKMTELENELNLLVLANDPQIVFQSLMSMLEMGLQSGIEITKNGFSGYDDRIKSEIVRGLGKTGSRLLVDFVVRDFQTSSFPLRMIYLEYLSGTIDNRHANWAGSLLSPEHPPEYNIQVLKLLNRFNREDSLRIIREMETGNYDGKVKLAAVKTRFQLGDELGFEVLKSMFNAESGKTRNEVVSHLADVYSEKSYDFLMEMMISKADCSERIFMALNKRRNQLISRVAFRYLQKLGD